MDKKILFSILLISVLSLVISFVGFVKMDNGNLKGDPDPSTFDDVTTTDDIVVGDDLTVTDDAAIGGDLSVTGTSVVDEFTQGGSVLSTSTTATAITFTVADLLTYSTWEVTPNTADLTYTFPASSTLSTIVPNAGDSRTWTIVNATSTAGIDVIFAAGTGSAVKGAGGAALTIDEASHGLITLTRKANSDIVITTFFPAAD